MLRQISSITSLKDVFIMMGCWSHSKFLSASIEMMIQFPSLSWLMHWYVYWFTCVEISWSTWNEANMMANDFLKLTKSFISFSSLPISLPTHPTLFWCVSEFNLKELYWKIMTFKFKKKCIIVCLQVPQRKKFNALWYTTQFFLKYNWEYCPPGKTYSSMDVSRGTVSETETDLAESVRLLINSSFSITDNI